MNGRCPVYVHETLESKPVYTYTHAYIHACIHTYIQTYIHTYIHIFIIYYYLFIFLFDQNIWPCPHEEDFARVRVQQGVNKNIIYIIHIYIYIHIHAHNYTYTIAHTGILRYSAHLCVYARLCTCRFVSARTHMIKVGSTSTFASFGQHLKARGCS